METAEALAAVAEEPEGAACPPARPPADPPACLPAFWDLGQIWVKAGRWAVPVAYLVARGTGRCRAERCLVPVCLHGVQA